MNIWEHPWREKEISPLPVIIEDRTMNMYDEHRGTATDGLVKVTQTFLRQRGTCSQSTFVPYSGLIRWSDSSYKSRRFSSGLQSDDSISSLCSDFTRQECHRDSFQDVVFTQFDRSLAPQVWADPERSES